VEIWEEEKGIETILPPKKVLQDLEENGCLDPDSNKAKVNYTKEPTRTP
jgi:hypothetical protein